MQSEGGAAGALHGAVHQGHSRDDVHGVPGPAADDAEHVQDRRRADTGRDPRRRPHPGHPRPVHLRRPLRRDGRPHDRLGHALRRQRPGGAGLRARRARGVPSFPRAVPALLRRLPHQPRGQHHRPGQPGRHARSDPRGGRAGPPRPRPHPRRPGAARCRAEPGHLLPGPRGLQPVLRRRPGRRRRSASTSSPSAPVARYCLVEYDGAPDADRVVVIMGSGGRRARGDRRGAERRGEKVGAVFVRAGSTGRSRPSSSSPRCPRPSARSPSWTAPRSRAAPASRCTWTSS